MTDRSNSSLEDLHRLRRIVGIGVVVEVLFLAWAFLYLPIHEKPYLLLLVAGLTGLPILFLVVRLSRKRIVCPSCQKPMELVDRKRCSQCGKDVVLSPQSRIFAHDFDKEFEEKLKTWKSPPELMVPTPRNIRSGHFSDKALYFRGLLLIAAIGLVIYYQFVLSRPYGALLYMLYLGVFVSFLLLRNVFESRKLVDYGTVCPGIIVDIREYRGGASAKIHYSVQGQFFKRHKNVLQGHFLGECVTLVVNPLRPHIFIVFPDAL